eukprot:gene3048-3812_t
MQAYPWLQHYPASVPFQINPDRYESLIGFFEEALEKYKNLPMLESMGKVLSYSDVNRLTQQFAAYIQNYTPLQPGDRIAIQLPNLLQYPIAMLGALRAGLVVVNVNPLYTAYELEQQVKNAAVKGIVILNNFEHTLASIIANTGITTVIRTEVGDLLGRVKGFLINFAMKRMKKAVPAYKFPDSLQITSLKKALDLGAKVEFRRIAPLANQPAFLQYTGGTTGVSKGVVLTHRHMIANMEQMFTFMHLVLEIGKEIVITALPLYHIYALTVNLLAPIHLGAKNVLIANPRNMKHFIKALRKHKFTFITGVNTLYQALLEHPDIASVNFSNLKISLAGGIALQDAIVDKWEKLTGSSILEGYGLTEAAPALTCNVPTKENRKGTVGIPLPSTLIKIVDEQGIEVPAGQPGHLLAQGPQVMEQYWNNPLETAQAFDHGWLQTGDIAIMSPDGYVKILDRKKEMINVSGFNVYPNEVENIVMMHPKVREAAVIGVYEAGGKEAVKLFVVKKDPSLTAEELLGYCRGYLTNYKLPRYIEFRDMLPKSNVGKVLRRVLQQEEETKVDVVVACRDFSDCRSIYSNQIRIIFSGESVSNIVRYVAQEGAYYEQEAERSPGLFIFLHPKLTQGEVLVYGINGAQIGNLTIFYHVVNSLKSPSCGMQQIKLIIRPKKKVNILQTLKYFINIVCLIALVSVGPVSSAKVPSIWPTGAYIGMDVVRPLYYHWQEKTGGQYELNAHLDFHRILLSGDYGWGVIARYHSPGKVQGLSSNIGRYFRIGCSYNLIANNLDHNAAFLGLGYGHAYFKDELYGELGKKVECPPWNRQVVGKIDSSGQFQAHWLEAIVGVHAKVWKWMFIGCTLRYKFAKKVEGITSHAPFDVIGWGLNDEEDVWGIHYYLSLRIPFQGNMEKNLEVGNRETKQVRTNECAIYLVVLIPFSKVCYDSFLIRFS